MSGLENTDDNTISRRYSALAHSFISLLSPDNGESVNTTNTSPAQPSTRSLEPGQGNQDPTRLSTHIMSTLDTRPSDFMELSCELDKSFDQLMKINRF